jgi:hypothetical protein
VRQKKTPAPALKGARASLPGFCYVILRQHGRGRRMLKACVGRIDDFLRFFDFFCYKNAKTVPDRRAAETKIRESLRSAVSSDYWPVLSFRTIVEKPNRRPVWWN